MKPRSAKNKGKRLQNNVRDLILEKFNQLEPDDVRSITMGDSGEDVLLSPAARKLFPFSVECKNQEKLNVWASLEQAEKNVKDGTYDGIIIAVGHEEFKDMGASAIRKLGKNKHVLFDLKYVLGKSDVDIRL